MSGLTKPCGGFVGATQVGDDDTVPQLCKVFAESVANAAGTAGDNKAFG